MNRTERFYRIDQLLHERRVRVLPQAARDMAERTPDAHYASAYGIFAGRPRQRAVLRFTPERSRWVRAQVRHPQQTVLDLPDGGLQLTVPYADEREPLMDILRHGHHVEVLAPAALRAAVTAEIGQMAQRYAAPTPCPTGTMTGIHRQRRGSRPKRSVAAVRRPDTGHGRS